MAEKEKNQYSRVDCGNFNCREVNGELILSDIHVPRSILLPQATDKPNYGYIERTAKCAVIGRFPVKDSAGLLKTVKVGFFVGLTNPAKDSVANKELEKLTVTLAQMKAMAGVSASNAAMVAPIIADLESQIAAVGTQPEELEHPIVAELAAIRQVNPSLAAKCEVDILELLKAEYQQAAQPAVAAE